MAMHPSTRARRQKQDGFATILVLVLIFLMFLLVVSYLRVMRTYAIKHNALQDGSMGVLSTLSSDIAGIIGADGLIGPPSAQNPRQTRVDIQEPYDFPWVNTARHASAVRVTYPKTKTSSKGLGDPLSDDAWLTFADPVGGLWPNVSSITGSFLVYKNADLKGIPPCTATKEAVPEDAPAGDAIAGIANGQSVAFTNLSVTDPRLVDTDGDGVKDSLWFYPRSNVIDGVRYVAAVKVVDLSGMLNINTALGELGSAPGSASGVARKGEGAYEVDASPLLGPMPALSKNFRQTDAASFPAPSGHAPGAWTDWDYWLTSGSLVNAPTAESVGNKLSLTGLRTGIRYDLNDDVVLRDRTDRIKPTLTPAPVVFDHYASLLGNTSLRGKLTTQSAVYDRVAPAPFSMAGNNAWVGYNYYTGVTRRAMDLSINQAGQWWVTYPTTQPDGNYMFWYQQYPFMQELLQGVDSTTPADDYPFPAGFKQLFAGSGKPVSDLPIQYQLQMADSLSSALDRTNQPTMGWNWVGYKALPIMTEFYAQMPYVVGAPYQTLPNGSSSPTTVKVFPNTTLANLTQANIANLAGTITTQEGTFRSAPYFYNQSATQIIWQYQYQGGGWLKCAGVKLTQVGSDVVATQSYAGYSANAAPGSNNFDPGNTGTQTVGNLNNFAYTAKLGLPTAAGSNWNQGYINTVKNRTAADPSMAATAGQYSGYGTTDWRNTGIAGVGSYAFELANPYATPIRLNNLRIRFRRNDRYGWDEAGGLATIPTAAPSQDLSSFITAATGLAKDAENNYVLKPGEKIVFYRNGLEFSGPGGARRRPMSGPTYVGAPPSPGTSAATDISPLIASGPGIYKVDLGTANTAPDINGYPSNWGCVATIELEVNCKDANGNNWGWLPYNHMVFQAPTSGYDQNHSYLAETNVPDGYQAAPGDLVYLQQDVRTFGSEEKLNLLQARPACFHFADVAKNVMPLDLGDTELRTNIHAVVGSGVLPNGLAKPYQAPAGGLFGVSYGIYDNTASTMPLGHPTSGLTYLSYDGTSGTSNISALGQSAKVSFRAPVFGGPNGGNAMYGGQRQDIRDGSLFWNYVGIPSDPTNYPGTFPELTADMACRDNTKAYGTNALRRDGMPRAMDMRKILLTGPIWWNFSTGNSTYRGTTTNGGWGGGGSAITTPTVDQLTSWYQYTIGDAINFYLAKDKQANGASAKGLPGLCLGTAADLFFDPSKIAEPALANKSLATLYTDWDAAIAARDAIPPPPPPPATDSNQAARDAANQNLATIGAGIRLQLFWPKRSWVDVIASRFQVDSPGWKGYDGRNSRDFKPGVINLNTASPEVLKCLSLPTGTDPIQLATGIVAARNAPIVGLAPNARPKGLAFIDDLKSEPPTNLLGSGATAAQVADVLGWLPAQASCRSDTFVAYVLLQGYRQDDFNLGPVSVRRAIIYFTRDTSGNTAKVVKTYLLPVTP